MKQKAPAGWRASRLTRGIPSTIRRDFAATVASQLITMASVLVVMHLVARRASVDGFAYYQVARGFVATLEPVVTIGLVAGLHRYLPQAGALAPSLARKALGAQLVVVLVAGLLGSVYARNLAGLLGIHGGSRPVQAIFVALAGTCLLSISVAASRGSGQVTIANGTLVLGLGVVPVVAFLLITRMYGFLALQGIGMCAVAVLGVAVAGRAGAGRPAPAGRRSGLDFPALVSYGVRRTAGDAALPALYSFPTFFVAGAAQGGSQAGYVGFTTSAIILICAVFAMLTPILLPRLSGRLTDPDVSSALWRRLLALPIAAAAIAVLASGVVVLTAGVVVRVFLGAEFSGAVRILQIGILASVPLAAFYAARPTLDALQDAPVTVKLLLVSLVLEVTVTYLGGRFCAPAAAAVLGLGAGTGALGLMSFLALRRAVPHARRNEEP